MKEILMFIWLVTVGVVVFVLLAGIVGAIKKGISALIHKYRYKHRFDKKPTAKCYCVDCKYHDNESGRCWRFHGDGSRSTADNWFCYAAEPRKKED